MRRNSNNSSYTASILRRARVNMGILLGGSGIAMLLNFGGAALNARALGPEGIGVIALFQASALLMAGLFSFGTQQPMIRLGKQALQDGNFRYLGAIASVAIVLDYASSFVAGVVSLFIVIVLADAIGLNPGMMGIAQLYTIVVFLSGVSASNGIFRLFNRFHYLVIAQTGNAVAFLGLSALFFFTKASLPYYLISFAVIYVVTAQLQVLLAIRMMKRNGVQLTFGADIVRSSGLGREFFSYAWTTNLTGVINSVRMNGEALLLGAMFGTATVGIYNVVRQVAGVFNKLASAASTAIFPEVAELASKRDFTSAKRLLYRVAALGLSLGLAGAFGFLVFGEQVLELAFGTEFTAGYLALVLMGLSGAVTLSSATFGGFVQAFSSPVRLLQLYLVAFGVYALAAPSLIYVFGLIGAPLAQIAFSLALWLGCWTILRTVLARPSKCDGENHE